MAFLVRHVRQLVVITLGALFALPVMAKEGDTFRPFVSYSRYYDGNLFRLDKSESTFVVQDGVFLPVSKQNGSDQYGVLSAGLNVDWRPGRQQILVGASKSQVRFSRFTSLDNDGSDYSLKWNWRVGNHWSGQAGASQSVAQSSFTDYAFQSVNNLVTRDSRFASADWQFHPRWRIGLGANAATSSNSANTQTALDADDKSVYALLGYATPKGSSLRGEIRQSNNEYPNRPINYRLYKQTELNLLADWNLTGKLVARAKLGYAQRDNDTLGTRNFSGGAGRLSADYFPTGKTALNWTIYREIGNSDDVSSTYQLSTGTSLGMAWQATAKISLRASASYENRNFESDVGAGGVQRDEDTLSGSLSLSYSPVRMATLDVGMQAGRRDSSITDGNYTFNAVFFNVRVDF